MKETITAVKVGDKDFRIHPFNAFSGASVFLFATKKIVPLLKALDIDLSQVLELKTTEVLHFAADMLGPVLDNIDPEELKKFMGECLAQVEILMPAGYVWLYRGDTFADEEVEFSTKTCFILCYHALKPILQDFFGDADLSSLLNPNRSTNRSPA